MPVLYNVVFCMGVLIVLKIGIHVNGCTYEQACHCTLVRGSWRADCSNLGLLHSPRFWPNVTEINLSKNKLNHFPNRSYLPDLLTYLDLSHNEIMTFKNNALRHLWNLSDLRLNGNALRVTKEINSTAFEDLVNIKHLDLSDNPHLTFRIMPILTRGIRNTTIEILRLNGIHCTFGLGSELRVEDVRFLKSTNLKEIHLSSNRIEQVENGVPYFFPVSIEKISAADNLFTFGLYLFEFIPLKNLRWLNASLQQMPHNPFTDRFLHICLNKRRAATSKMESLSYNQTINYAVENQKTISRLGKVAYNITVPVPPNLKIVYGEEMGLRYNIPIIRFSQNSIEEVYMQGNTFYRWTGPILGLLHLRILNLSNNFCSSVSEKFFSSLPRLSELYMSNNLLGFSLALDTDGKIFYHLRSLRCMDLKANKIAHLPFMVFKNLKTLKHLDLGNNLLTTIEFDLINLKSLEHLDLSGNQIQYFDQTTRKKVSQLVKQTKLSLNLLNNPLQCDCKTLGFLQWMIQISNSGKIKFQHFRNYTCTKSSTEGKVLKFTNIEHHIEELIKECSSYNTLIFIIASLILLFLVALSAGLVYRYRWKLRYFYYMTKSRYHGYKSVRGDDQSDFKYDAFVSYADEEMVFVREMISELEGERKLNLCIHHRDFVPGYDIAENIITAINKSKKTIIVLSPNFINSSWCMYELHIAKMEEIYSRDDEDILFLICYQPIPADKIPLGIMDVINQKSYIEFPNDEYGNTVFWNRLREALM